jgi:hypothetical protein
MRANSTFFGSGLRGEGIDLERVIRGCKEITLDYEWYFKGGREYRRYIGFYVDSQEITRVYLREGPIDNPGEAKKILSKAYASLEKEVKLPKRVKVNAFYLKGAPGKEKSWKIK